MLYLSSYVISLFGVPLLTTCTAHPDQESTLETDTEPDGSICHLGLLQRDGPDKTSCRLRLSEGAASADSEDGGGGWAGAKPDV